MLEYQGEYGKAKVMLDGFENDGEKTVKQIYEFLNHPAFTNPVSIMPDCHVGKGAVIGFTMKLTDKVIPNVIGVDIGCGMLSFNLRKNFFLDIGREELNSRIRENIPFSTDVRSDRISMGKYFYDNVTILVNTFAKNFNNVFKTSYQAPKIIDEKWFKNKCKDIGMDYDRAVNSIGSLGGGNHFIEFGIDENDDVWGTIHSGSRQFGLKIATFHQRKAGKGTLAFLQDQEMFDYLIDMVVAQKYADYNRQEMLNQIINITDISPFDRITSVHNYIDFNDFIIRKGAISSYTGQLNIIPFNMEDGILICEGKSNPEWNYSAPHGAGRTDSRRWAKENLDLEKAKERMKKNDIYCSTTPVDETKKAYKDPKIIEDQLDQTAKIIHRIKPLMVCKSKK